MRIYWGTKPTQGEQDMDQERIKFFLLNRLSPQNEADRVRLGRLPYTRQSLLELEQSRIFREVPNDVVEAEFDRLVETGQIAVSGTGELSLGKVIFEHAKPVSETAEKTVAYLHKVVLSYMPAFNECWEDVQAEIKNSLAVIVDEQLAEHNNLRVFPVLHLVSGEIPVSILGRALADQIVDNINDRRSLFLQTEENGSSTNSFQGTVEAALEEAGVPKQEYQPTARDVANLLKLREDATTAIGAIARLRIYANAVRETRPILDRLEEIEDELQELRRRYTDSMPSVHVEGVEEAKVERGMTSHQLGGFYETFRVNVEEISVEDGGKAKILDLVPGDPTHQQLFFRLQSWDEDCAHQELAALNLDKGDQFVLSIERQRKIQKSE